ncbi:uncharacterized protein LTR77_004326 [Saxophila tyrrhenica]|uniref:Ubiquitin-like domain-containing protein n=1 Tax=Saxophila tyrrhenica TaxID=1690608 RepID=A0AAV9PCG9_9PEZI|nr:hypothetical protein LTR77_004326 [Saxophila tyrrhenica]
MAAPKTAEKLNVRLDNNTYEGQTRDRIVISRTMVNSKRTQKLEIYFKRTVRVTDNGSGNELPPGLGSFPVYSIEDYKNTLPAHMVAKQGYFIPMHQREAMWIKFSCQQPFAIKIYVGGVNAVSGEPARETTETMMRRLKLTQQRKSIQDYVVAPEQMWLDGIACGDEKVRQFVAMPLGEGYSVEAHITGEEVVGGLQFEVTPTHHEPQKVHYCYGLGSAPEGVDTFRISVITLEGSEYHFKVHAGNNFSCVKEMMEEMTGVPPYEQRLIYGGRQMHDHFTLGQQAIVEGARLHQVLRLTGGGCPTMGIAVGGLIRQTVKRDKQSPSIWQPDCGTIFNVQILNSSYFQEVTGLPPPPTPVTAETYSDYGYPYFKMFDETPSGVQGAFAGIKSVNEMDVDGKPSAEKAKAVAEVSKNTNNPVVLLDEKARRVGFRTVLDLEMAVRKRFAKMKV